MYNDPGDTDVEKKSYCTNGNTDSVSSNTTYQTGTTIIGTYGKLKIRSMVVINGAHLMMF